MLVKNNKIAFVLSEDRPDFELGVRLAIASISFHAPDNLIRCYIPWANIDFQRWCEQFKNVELVKGKSKEANSWNCKPHAMIPLLEAGFEKVVWIDSDILVTNDPVAVFGKFQGNPLVTAEEPAKPYPVPDSVEQAKAWGWSPGIRRENHISSCIVMAQNCHLELLRDWQKCVANPKYLEYQSKPFSPEHRPFHMMGDQDVLFSLLGSEKHAWLKLEILRIGKDILHSGTASAYPSGRRLCSVFNPCPAFLHAIAGKPWWVFSKLYPTIHFPWQTWIHRLQQEISPYVIYSRFFSKLVEIPIPWMKRVTILGLFFRLMGFGNLALTGLPLTLVATFLFKFKTLVISKANKNSLTK